MLKIKDNKLYMPLTNQWTDDTVQIKMAHWLNDLQPENQIWAYNISDLGFAKLFSDMCQDYVKYATDQSAWYCYENGKWQEDGKSATLVRGYLHNYCTLMRGYALTIDVDGVNITEEKKAEYIKVCSKLESSTVMDRLLKEAKVYSGINSVMFDNDPYLLNCINSTINLWNGKHQPSSPRNLITKQTNCTYGDKRPSFPRWKEFIKEVMSGDDAEIAFLQRALGYSIFGNADEECMFIAYGSTTRNGKSTLLNSIQYILGDYAKSRDVSFVLKSLYGTSCSSANPMLYDLKGCRFLVLHESDKMQELDTNFIKNITGNDPITTRNLYSAPITFTPQFTMWLSCNNLPEINDPTVFESERIHVIEFKRHFTQAEQDKSLKRLFKTEKAKEEIMWWLVDGYLQYKANGLQPTLNSKYITKQYASDTDKVSMFIEEMCKVSDNDRTRIHKTVLFKKYCEWCRDKDIKPMNRRGFNEEMKKKRFEEIIRDGYSYFKNITMKGLNFK